MFLLIHINNHPFRKQLSDVNRLETVSSLIILTSFFFSALLFSEVDPSYEKDRNLQILNYLFFYVIYFANALFCVYAFRMIYINEKYNLKPLIDKGKRCICFPVNFIKSICFRTTKFLRKSFFVKTTMIEIERVSARTSQIELNPLADWDQAPLTRKSLKLKESREQILITSLRKKIKLLSMNNLLQRAEIRRLKKIKSEIIFFNQ